ncbi:ATPase associated with various cellular activities AAA_3 [Halovivax asiaticus JCM 14624]|uniref:ATPase associated with various cellular activities AAA_3 n=1 Tax=Halovivax asiaticus JCM 14624 TaxID=1227490 RepID=M0BGW2_9EURY|nr:MoxR family ATPase [Halovivax asiaticus]ELZ09508.1 ATPase associated with various cellular activities AAA_3 [Halovivax asiaticus JCM 14624]
MNVTDPSAAASTCEQLLDEIGEAVIADREFLETVLVGVLARGHVLLEDVPGTGKTLTAKSIASALDLPFSRIQFTPDLLPADVTGTHIYDEHEATFEFTEGPLFANVVLADEINRAPPKTQAALLEAMSERQVTVAGDTMSLPDPFVVIATQNPVESEGTFPLPEAQVDRFAVKTAIGYPGQDGEATLLRQRTDRTEKLPSVSAVCSSADDVRALQAAPEAVTVTDDLIPYMTAITAATRRAERVRVGVSPRGTQRLLEVSRAKAVLDGRDYLAPDDITTVAPSVLAHRLVLTPEAAVEDVSKRAILADALESVPVPTVSRSDTPAPE